MATKKMTKGELKEVHVPLKWHIPDSVITRFVSNMVVQTMENEFKISFFEIKPEILLNPSEPPPKEVRAECVASIIVTPDRLPKFIEVLQRNLDQYNSIKKIK
jgi:hypothetical protein